MIPGSCTWICEGPMMPDTVNNTGIKVSSLLLELICESCKEAGMELASVSLNAFSTSNSQTSSCLSSFRHKHVSYSSSFKGSLILPISLPNLRRCSVRAVSGNTTISPDGNSVLGEEDRKDANKDFEDLDGHKMTRVCDKLIDVFMVDKPAPNEWRKLLAFSREWDDIRPHFFKRCDDRAETEKDPGMKYKLSRLGRKLKEVDGDIQRHNQLLEMVRKSPANITDIVSRRRKDFTNEFFVHVNTVAESYYDNPAEQNAVAKLGNLCLEAVQAFDDVTESKDAVIAAELKLQDIINAPSLDAACRKIDDLAAKNQLDSTLVLMIAKAWSAAKESDMTKGEVKDVLYHLYKTARGNLQRLVPKEVRIAKYLLTIKDPEELVSALNDAFTPGEELEGKDEDCLYTTPIQLHTWIRAVVDAYHLSREGTVMREARDLMNPEIIVKLEELKKLIQDKFM